MGDLVRPEITEKGPQLDRLYPLGNPQVEISTPVAVLPAVSRKGKQASATSKGSSGVTGQYVKGMWKNGWEWESNPYAKRLRWQANGVAVEFFFMGMEITNEDMMSKKT